MKDREKYKELLIDAVGEIDDSYVHEASVYKARRLSVGARAFIAAASSFAAVIFLSVIIGISFLNSYLNATLYDVLEKQSGTTVTQVGKSELSEPCLIWQLDGKEEYHIKSVSFAQYASVIKTLNAEQVNSPENEITKEPGIRVWLCSPEGTVITPYLKVAEGNISYGAIFSYNAEVMPSFETVSAIREIMKG